VAQEGVPPVMPVVDWNASATELATPDAATDLNS